MDFNEGGFLRPKFETPMSVELDQTVLSLCPGYNLALEGKESPVDLLWGPILKSREGWATRAQFRHGGASGGVLSALADFLLTSGEVHGVIQVRENPTDPTQNETVLSVNSEQVLASAGSRYAPSAPLSGLYKYLDDDKTYAIFAKPCDIAAVRQWMRIDERVRVKFPYLISFFCAGVPSARASELLNVSKESLKSFRYRGNGWPGYLTAETQDGRVSLMSYHESWGEILSRHVQFRCKICPDGTGEFADIACADAWECDEKGYPVFSEGQGVSLMLTRTELGEKLVERALHQGVISAHESPISKIEQMQPGQFRRKRMAFSRLLALSFMYWPVPKFKGLRLLAAARSAPIKASAYSFLGTLKRLLLKQDSF
jgi:coenzyme F420 hydrogenase subunit beta